MTTSVVIPCYNVGEHVEEVISGLPDEITWIIAVNDCSTDNTESVLLRLQTENKKLIYIRHEKNKGVGGAMMTGYKKSLELKADLCIKMDGDGQMDPANIIDLIRPIRENMADFTKGNRFKDLKALRSMPFNRRMGNLGLSFLIKAASGYWNIFDPTNGFTAIRREVLMNVDFNKIDHRYFFESSMLIELYYCNAVVMDIPMNAVYGKEVSGLSPAGSFLKFPPKLIYAMWRRILLKYFLFDFNIASLYIVIGLPLFIFGAIFGIFNFIWYSNQHLAAPTGTVVIPTLLIILGFQLLLSAVSYDIGNYPKRQ